MKRIILMKTQKEDIIKNTEMKYIWTLDNRIDDIFLKKDNNDLVYILINHYDNNGELNILVNDYIIDETINNKDNSTDLYKYDNINDTLALNTYTAENTMTFTDITFDIENNKLMLGRYSQVDATKNNIDGVYLTTNDDFASVITKTDTTMLWNKTITQNHIDSNTGPLISKFDIDENNNIYYIGESTNYPNIVDIYFFDETIINPKIEKGIELITLITKSDKDGNTLWVKEFLRPSDSLFLNPKIIYNKTVFFSFNFSHQITIDDTVFTTASKEIINNIIGEIDIDGNIIWVKQLSSEKYNSIIDITVDKDYIFAIGKFNSEAKFDNYTVFQNGKDPGYIIKLKKDGTIINIINVYSDDILKLNSIITDVENIIVSGAWVGNIYFNGKIKYSDHLDFFITNIKKKNI